MTVLLPCPFCGRSASIEQYGDRGQSTIYQCDNCSCSLETGEEWSHGQEWNRRSLSHPPTEAMVEAAKAAYWHEVHHGGGYSDKCYEAAITAALAAQTVKPLDLGITKEWFEKRSEAEGDLEVGAGFSIVNPSAADIATMERLLLKSLPEWAQTEIKAYRALSHPSQSVGALKALEWTQADAERENAAFHEWWKKRGYDDFPDLYTLTCQNAMHAAWQEAAERSALESSAPVKALAPVDVYRILKRTHDNGMLDGDHLSSLSREIATLHAPAPVKGETEGNADHAQARDAVLNEASLAIRKSALGAATQECAVQATRELMTNPSNQSASEG